MTQQRDCQVWSAEEEARQTDCSDLSDQDIRARVAQQPLRQRDFLQQAVGARTWQLVQLAVAH